MLTASELFDLDDKIVTPFLRKYDYVWQSIENLDLLVNTLCGDRSEVRGEVSPLASISGGPVFVHETAVVKAGTVIEGPCYLGPNTVVGPSAYLRQNVIMLNASLVGHCSEAKNALFLPTARALHKAFVGDSILGSDVNLGSGTMLSNLPITFEKSAASHTPQTISIDWEDTRYDTGLSKLGAILGDRCRVGCNSVLNPGVVLGAGCMVYALTSVRKGVYRQNSVLRSRQKNEVRESS